MGHSVTLGGDRLGSGKKQKVHLHGYERSTHDKSYLWRNTQSAGTLVPFMKQVTRPGDTWSIRLDIDVKTHPTIGPLFGSFSVRADIFWAAIRLYQGKLHNNAIKIGMAMQNVKLPIITLEVGQTDPAHPDIDNCQINPSCILPYLGIRGVGFNPYPDPHVRDFNAVPLLMLWDAYKCYYANKQEEIGAVIHNEIEEPGDTVVSITINATTILMAPGDSNYLLLADQPFALQYTFPGPPPQEGDIIFETSQGDITLEQLLQGVSDDGAGTITATVNWNDLGDMTIHNWRYRDVDDPSDIAPRVSTFPLDDIDKMREAILGAASTASVPFSVNDADLFPYKWILGKNGDFYNKMNTQEGLPVICYKSDLLNNWLNTEWIDGTNGISEVTSIDTSGGSFTMDTLALTQKVYEMLNRIAVSDGTYDSWQKVQYDHEIYGKTESPIYCGGLVKELGFEEVISNAETTGDGTTRQPLGTLAGKGIMLDKHQGGNVTVKSNELGYIMGLVSITPRIDYSQGNEWDIHLKTMDDFHKPALDEIGFQDLVTSQMAWWSSVYAPSNEWIDFSAGKQPAWTNYMTEIPRTYGNFARKDNEMFMTLNRRYEFDNAAGNKMKDLTTYIDPVKYNYIFAETNLDAMNYWVQIGVEVTLRAKQSAKIMSNL